MSIFETLEEGEPSEHRGVDEASPKYASFALTLRATQTKESQLLSWNLYQTDPETVG